MASSEKPPRRAESSAATERIVGCLLGVAVGDAIGKQTEGLRREDVIRWYPGGIQGFEGAPGTVIPRYAGNRKREWRVGETTDDTERTIAVARAILRDGAVGHTSVGREMLACRKCVHPGVRSLWEFHQAGDPGRIAEQHDGCGAAVRVAPVGIRFTPDRLDDIVEGAIEASIPTHGGPLALAAAAATAAAVSAAIDGAPGDGVLSLAADAADRAEVRRRASGGTAFASALTSIAADLRQRSPRADAVAQQYFPTDPLTIVPLALALATTLSSAGAAILLAANVGGDSDSVASIAGAVLGARAPATLNQTWCRIVEDVNGHGLAVLAADLGALRS